MDRFASINFSRTVFGEKGRLGRETPTAACTSREKGHFGFYGSTKKKKKLFCSKGYWLPECYDLKLRIA